MVTIYSKNNCMQCNMTKKELIKLGVTFTEINLDEHPEYIQQVKDLGFTAAPVIQTPTDIWAGFQPAKLKALV